MSARQRNKEDIATAMLLGCEFYPHPNPDGETNRWWVHRSSIDHPLEVERTAGWASKGALARDFIKFTLESNGGA